ncbi:hypothetical protein HOM13_04390 [Candidatus Woesearchaeota archaeon]|jgi:regulator of protease activity HflC (stomatin/prohibitin superfamily)|nr:hypothetical protein [Candidatus Woesearchaeota archaeon]MBT5215946.1 hypothetical protein [Candidatus Woesearchaeota archaeon]MBT6402341.1 hypothetical protein [Candidatus Woesearchaeota archaeon]
MIQEKSNTKKTVLSTIVVVLVIAFVLWGIPNYAVYSKELNGKAQLKQAEWSRQIAIQEAKAEKEAALLKKDADIIRAEGVAESNRIISKSLTEEYIKWKWVEGLHDGSSEVIYVPTEANMPILEAGSRVLN